MMKQFAKDEGGVVAVIFALMAIPFIALGGWTVDYVRLQHVNDHLQAQADAAALNYWVEDAPADQWRMLLLAELDRKYEGAWARDVAVENALNDSGSDVTVTVTAQVPLSFMHIIPGIPQSQTVVVSAIARVSEPTEIRKPPINTTLDPEAGDYNRIWMYCYWPSRDTPTATLPKRTRMVPIADNGGSEFVADTDVPPSDAGLRIIYEEILRTNHFGLDGQEEGAWRLADGAGTADRVYRYMLPDCPAGSHLSLRLENVRFARSAHRYWDEGEAPNGGGDRHTGRFDYYTDTYFSAGDPTEQYAHLMHPTTAQPVQILETVLCDTLEECRSGSGGVVPSGTGRNPQRASGECEPGKYMYYGWEDRPPGQTGASGGWQDFAWTDRDYDDIRVIIECPTFVTEGERSARLVG
ncbi:TadE/TadG family type IV pilus assembly protein [Pelagibacterium montanilacus]|uniref:TadE/TadG family type IV pilus assembly protein n=1 Tax=Pelagibacterium montanilacus TaxID=2185280 RepID=UPI000F8E3A6D|nr:pilus assembly protein TadG-related protein [Pelagibacterium montanilacus]